VQHACAHIVKEPPRSTELKAATSLAGKECCCKLLITVLAGPRLERREAVLIHWQCSSDEGLAVLIHTIMVHAACTGPPHCCEVHLTRVAGGGVLSAGFHHGQPALGTETVGTVFDVAVLCPALTLIPLAPDMRHLTCHV
jgi:hypothetical protein